MAQGKLIDEHVSEKQCKMAVDALLDHALKAQQKKQDTELLADKEQNVWLVVTVKQMHPEKKLKPHRMCVISICCFLHIHTRLQMLSKTARTSFGRPTHIGCMSHHQGSSTRI